MFEVDIKEQPPVSGWNDLVGSLPEGTIFQTTYWADYLKNTGHCQPFFCAVKDGAEPKGILLFWVEKLNNRSRPDNKLASLLGKLSEKLDLSYAYWYYGPLVLDKEKGAEIMEAILKAVDNFARVKKIIALKSMGEPIYYSEPEKQGRYDNIYSRFNYSRQDKGTIFIELPQDENLLWKGLKKNTRRDVSSCQRHSLAVELLNEDNLDEYREVIVENIKRVGAEFPPYYPDRNMWNALCSGQKRLAVLVVKSGNKILGGKGIIEFNGIIFHMTSCQSDESYFKKINVNDLLIWEVAKWAIAANKKIYDLTGIPMRPKNRKEGGLRNFKMKWSRKLQVFGAYEKTYRKPIKLMIDIARNFV